MRPSQYHYIKRMWVRSSYKRKEKRKHILLLPFRLFYNLYSFPFILMAYPFKSSRKIKTYKNNMSTETIKGILGGISILFIIFLILYCIQNFFYLFGYGPLILFVIFLSIFIYCKWAKKEIYELPEEILEHIKTLAEIVNTTKDEDIFETSLNEIKIELNKLVSYEKSGCLGPEFCPSKDLEKITANEQLTRKRFEERKKFDVEQYAKMCNSYIEHQEEMEQYKDSN